MGGQVHAFMATLPKLGSMALTLRDPSLGERDAQDALQPESKQWGKLGQHAAEHQVRHATVVVPGNNTRRRAEATHDTWLVAKNKKSPSSCSNAHHHTDHDGTSHVGTPSPHTRQVGVDIFVLAQTYVDIASLGQLCRTTGGQLYSYGKFDARSDTAQLFNDLRWCLIRPQVRHEACCWAAP